MIDLALGRTQRFGLTNSACLKCGEVTDTFVGYDKAGSADKPPTPGDVTLCVRCGHLQAIADDRESFRPLTAIEDEAFSRDPRVMQLRQAQSAIAATGEGVKSVEILRRGSGSDLAVVVHDACMAYFGYAHGDRKGFTESQILDIAAAGATLTASYLEDLPYKRRLEVVTDFIEKMLLSFKGKGPR